MQKPSKKDAKAEKQFVAQQRKLRKGQSDLGLIADAILGMKVTVKSKK